MASRARVEEYRRLNANLVTLAQRDLAAFWKKLDKSNVVDARRKAAEFLAALTETYGRPAALIAAQFYDDLRASSKNATGQYRAILADGPTADQIDGSVRWAVAPLATDKPDDAAALARLQGAAQRYITQHGRGTIALNSSRDPSRGAWARVPSGGKVCDFCLMLASRGAVYRSAESAGDGADYHDNCHCVPTQIWDGDDLPDGYDPDALYEDYSARQSA
jgi:hypothetical protein